MPLPVWLPRRVPSGIRRNCVCGGNKGCRCKCYFCNKGRHKLTAKKSSFFVFLSVVACSSGLSAETKGVYVLFFLLSALILMLLVAAGMLYRRHHRGAFLVHCHKAGSISSHEPKKEGSFCPDAELPPPPPPLRGYKEGRPPVDLPLLRFNPLLPSEDGK